MVVYWCYIGVILAVYWGYIGVILGLDRDNGEENGNYYSGDILFSPIAAATKA